MPTIALIAAGTRLGLSLGKVFGAQGFDVALLARSADRLDNLVGTLAADGITAAGFTADVADPASVTTALTEAAERFGGIEVMQYSAPYARVDDAGMTAILDVTAENLRPQLEASCYGAITATRAVLPTMIAAGTGTLLFTTGASAVTPVPWAGSTGPAGAALRNWALNLHGAVADHGVFIGYLALGAWLTGTPGTPDDVTPMHPDDVARTLWDMHSNKAPVEQLITQ